MYYSNKLYCHLLPNGTITSVGPGSLILIKFLHTTESFLIFLILAKYILKFVFLSDSNILLHLYSYFLIIPHMIRKMGQTKLMLCCIHSLLSRSKSITKSQRKNLWKVQNLNMVKPVYNKMSLDYKLFQLWAGFQLIKVSDRKLERMVTYIR